MKTKFISCKTIATTLAILLLWATPALADGAYEIYTYGSGDFVAQVLKGVALVMSGGYIQTLIKVVLLVGLLTALLNPVTSWLSSGGAHPGDGGTGGEGFIAILRQVLLAVVVMYIFIIPKANVAIIDRYDSSQSQVVSDVPFIQAIIAHGASIIGDVIGREMEAAFNLPDAMTFRNGGLGVGVKHINNIYNILPPGPDMDTTTYSNLTLVSLSLREYFNNCVYPNFATLDGPNGPKTTALRDLAQSRDIFTTLDNHKTLFGDSVKRITAPTTSGDATCAEAPAIIKNVWDTGKTPWIQHIEKESQNGISAIVLQRYFPNGGDYFTMLQTIAAGNIMRSTLRGYEAKNAGNASQIAGDQALASTVGGWQTTAKMFEKIVNVMRNVFEGLIYGLSVFLPVAIAVAGLKPVGVYMKIVLWLQLWVPFYVLLNLFGDMELARTLSALSIENDGSFPTLAIWREVGEKTQTSLAYLGSLSFTIPMFAWGLMQGGSYAMSSAMQSMSGGGATAAAQRIGSQAGLDSLQYGNRSTNSYSDKNGTAFGADFDYTRTLGGQSGTRSVTGYGENASSHFSKVGARGAGMEAGLNTSLTPMDSVTVGKISGEQQKANAHGEINAAAMAGKSTLNNMTDRAFLDKGTQSISVARTQEKLGDLSKAAYAEGDKTAANINAEAKLTSGERDTRAHVRTQKEVGSAEAFVEAAKDYHKSEKELAKSISGFENMSSMEKLNAFMTMGGSKEGMRSLLNGANRTITRATEGGARVTESYGRDGHKGFVQTTTGTTTTRHMGDVTTVQGTKADIIGAGKEGTAERAAWGAIHALNTGSSKEFGSEMNNLAEAIVGKGPNALERVWGNRDNLEIFKQTLSNAATRYGDATGKDNSYTTLEAGAKASAGVSGGVIFKAGLIGEAGFKKMSQGMTSVDTKDLTKAIHEKTEQVAADNTNYPSARAKTEGMLKYTASISNNLREAGNQSNFDKTWKDSNPIPQQNGKGITDTISNATAYSPVSMIKQAMEMKRK